MTSNQTTIDASSESASNLRNAVLQQIQDFCAQHEGDLAGIGACAALKAMVPYWESHFRDGCEPDIIRRDLAEVESLFAELLLQLSALKPAAPNAGPGTMESQGAADAECTIVVGMLYELPDGRIARTYGWSGRTGQVSYAFDDDSGGHQILAADTATWKPRPDLRDFPNARDPLLPYAFDLHYDIKWQSQLKRELQGHPHESELRALMQTHGINV